MLTQEELRKLFDYSPDDGQLRWRVRKPCHNGIGIIAGYQTSSVTKGGKKNSYVRIKIDGVFYMAHVVIWMWMTGEWLPRKVDHVDCDGTNNRWSNLRKTTGRLNMANTRMRSDNKTGFKGVCIKKGNRSKKYVAQINDRGKTRVIGYFLTPEEASQAYLVAAKSAFGQFAREK